MHAMIPSAAPPGAFQSVLFALTITIVIALTASACKKKVTQDQCDKLLDHFAELVVKERYADAGADAIAVERARERQEAKTANEFKNCTSEVQTNEYDCAMKAQTSDGLIKCLE
jgi:hypothetical protein